MKLTPRNIVYAGIVLIVLAIAHALFISVDSEGNLWKYIVLGIMVGALSLLMLKASLSLRQLEANEIKYMALLDAAPDATIIVGNTGLIEIVNQQTENIFGYQREELVGMPVEVLIPQELREAHIRHRENYAKAPKVRSMGVGMELNAIKKNGSSFPVEISLSPIETAKGRVVAASIRDITHRKILENELKRMNDEAEAFTYSVSHDLRAPLRGILGFTAILEEDYASQLDQEAKRITGIIKNNAQNMGRLIDDLLAFSRMGRKEIIKMDINMRALVDDVIKELAPAGKQQEIIWDIQELPRVKGDIGTLRQVWINLLSNAVKYSAGKPHPIISIGSFARQGQRAFFVRDNGVGFDERYKDKLFKVFQRLHNAEAFEGTGVGLALVEKIISKHGGQVWATGQVGQGATFYFSLP